MNTTLYYVMAEWDGQVLPVSTIAQRFIETLDRLEEIEPRFGDWVVGVPDGVEPLAQHRTDMAEVVGSNVFLDDYDKPQPQSGYWCYGCNCASRSPEIVPDSTRIIMRVGGGELPSEFRFEIGGPFVPPDLTLVTYPIFKSLVRTLASIWAPPWVSAQCRIWGESLPRAPVPFSNFQMPWVAYLDAESVRGVAPVDGLAFEPGPGGGLIISAVDSRLDPDDPDHLLRSQRLAELMMARAPRAHY